MARYIDPATDFGFKRIFKDEEITRGFLNALLQSEYPNMNITKVTITDGELDESHKDIRRVVYDVHCVTDDGSEFVIEMQNESQEFFPERIVYYLSRAASRQQDKGLIDFTGKDGKNKKKPWDYHLKNIYGVFFMNFKDEVHYKGLSRFALMETSDHYIDTEVFQYWKIQMPYYKTMKESDCKTDIDKWIFNLSNMNTMETSLSFANEIPLFMRLGSIASYSELTPQQQVAYDDSYHNYVSYHGQMEYKYNKGREEGREEGRAEGLSQGMAQGMAQQLLENVRNLMSSGFDFDKAVELLKIPADKIDALREMVMNEK